VKAKISIAEHPESFPPPHVGGYGWSSAVALSVRLRHGGPQGAKPKAEVVADIPAGIRERRA